MSMSRGWTSWRGVFWQRAMAPAPATATAAATAAAAVICIVPP